MLKKKVISVIICSILCTFCVCGVLAYKFVTSQSDQIQSREILVDQGSISAFQYQATFALTSRNRETINFWIQNNGSNEVKMTINGEHGRTIQPGAQGHISADIGYLTKDYKFKVVSGKNGGDVNIEYKIVQRNESSI